MVWPINGANLTRVNLGESTIEESGAFLKFKVAHDRNQVSRSKGSSPEVPLGAFAMTKPTLARGGVTAHATPKPCDGWQRRRLAKRKPITRAESARSATRPGPTAADHRAGGQHRAGSQINRGLDSRGAAHSQANYSIPYWSCQGGVCQFFSFFRSAGPRHSGSKTSKSSCTSAKSQNQPIAIARTRDIGRSTLVYSQIRLDRKGGSK
jgi:hypothetical protein